MTLVSGMPSYSCEIQLCLKPQSCGYQLYNSSKTKLNYYRNIGQNSSQRTPTFNSVLARIFFIHSDRNSENFILSVGLPGVDNVSDYWGIFKIYTDIDEITTETDYMAENNTAVNKWV